MRALTVALLFAITFNVYGQVPDYVPSDGLVAWYPFNGNANDESPNENNGSIFGPVLTHDRFNEPNAAFAFEHNRIEVPNSEGLDQIRTISFWFNSNSNVSNQVAFKQNIFEDAQSERMIFTINWNGAWCHFATKENCNTSWQYDNFSFSGNDGNWHHFVGLLDGNEKRIYIDGNFMISSPVNLNNLCSGGNCIIGQEWSGVNYDFIGSLDDFGFWNRALTTEEIANLFSTPAPQDGCTDETACNFDDAANTDDGSCILSGCMDTDACNFNPEAECDGGACDYTCCPGPGCCGVGMNWNSEIGECEITNPTDTNLDGCTDLNDLMDILAAYGDCAVAEFTCGNPLGYQGYDYETVLIGEQCWFAESLQTIEYFNGDPILVDLDNQNWTSTSDGAASFAYGEAEEVNIWGMIYNGFAVLDERGLCPSGWHVSSDQDFLMLESFLGLVSGLTDIAYRGEDINLGGKIKEIGTMQSYSGWWYYPNNGANNESGLSMRATGWRSFQTGLYEEDGGQYGLDGNFWTSTPAENGESMLRRRCDHNGNGVKRDYYPTRSGFSVRCIKD